MVIEMIKFIVATTYDGGDLHILEVRATKLQQALETIFMKKNIKSTYVASFKYVISMKDLKITTSP